MEVMTLNNKIEKLQHILREAGKYLLKQNVMIDCHKNKNDLLTQNDIDTETFLVKEITRFDPRANIISEENYANNSLDGCCYVIDPIDGTCNYAAGLPLFGIQVAYFEYGEEQFSILHYPKSGDTLLAIKNRGSFWNGKLTFTQVGTSPSDGILLISDYYDNVKVPLDKQFKLVKALQPHFLKTRHFGAACIDFSFLTKGIAAAYICYYSKIWDIAPGLLAALESGCVCSSIDGSPYQFGNSGLVVANNRITLQLILDKFAKL